MSVFDSIKKVFLKTDKAKGGSSLANNQPATKTVSGSTVLKTDSLNIANQEKLQQALKLGPAGQSKEAMQLVLSVLQDVPDNQQALGLAETILNTGYNSLGWLLINDPLLDSLFAQCSKCGAFWPVNPMYRFAGSVHISNPVGGKCPDCGKVLCRNCAVNEFGSLSCPNHEGAKRTMQPVLNPTGRQRRVTARSSKKNLAHAIILRQSPEPPRIAGYLTIVLEASCSEALTDKALITFQMYDSEITETAIIAFLSIQKITKNWPNYLDANKYEVNFEKFNDPDGGLCTLIRVYYS